jgi:glycine cleavage system H protein
VSVTNIKTRPWDNQIDWEDIRLDQGETRYSPEHLWVRIDEDSQATIGLSEEALQDGEEIVKVRLPSEGDEIIKEESVGRLTTSRPAVFRIYAPVTGEVVDVNDDIIDAPEMILEDPYEEGWLIRVEMSSITDFDELMTRDEYEDYIADSLGDLDDLDDDEIEDELEGDDEQEDDDY